MPEGTIYAIASCGFLGFCCTLLCFMRAALVWAFCRCMSYLWHISCSRPNAQLQQLAALLLYDPQKTCRNSSLSTPPSVPEGTIHKVSNFRRTLCLVGISHNFRVTLQNTAFKMKATALTGARHTCVTSAVCPTRAYFVFRVTASHTYAKLSMAHVTNSSLLEL